MSTARGSPFRRCYGPQPSRCIRCCSPARSSPRACRGSRWYAKETAFNAEDAESAEKATRDSRCDVKPARGIFLGCSLRSLYLCVLCVECGLLPFGYPRQRLRRIHVREDRFVRHVDRDYVVSMARQHLARALVALHLTHLPEVGAWPQHGVAAAAVLLRHHDARRLVVEGVDEAVEVVGADARHVGEQHDHPLALGG